MWFVRTQTTYGDDVGECNSLLQFQIFQFFNLLIVSSCNASDGADVCDAIAMSDVPGDDSKKKTSVGARLFLMEAGATAGFVGVGFAEEEGVV